MRRFLPTGLLVVIVCALVASLWRHGQPPPEAPRARAAHRGAIDPRLIDQFGRIPLHFESNEGQADASVRFIARGAGYAMYLGASEAAVTIGVSDSTLRSRTVRLRMVGANAQPAAKGEDELPSRVNYFRGGDPTAWRTDVRTFAKARYRNVYSGIDVVYYGNQRQLEHDYIVAPGADPRQIRLQLSGVDDLTLDENGHLVAAVGTSQVTLRAPVAYQNGATGRRSVGARYAIGRDNVVAIRVGSYNEHLPLVIDPVLVYSASFGGSDQDEARAVAVDGSGAVYVTGVTYSANFPIQDPFQSLPDNLDTLNPPSGDAFVMKLSAAGTLVYSTYLGGRSTDEAFSIAVDSSGSAYVVGMTYSGGVVGQRFPTTSGAIRPTPLSASGFGCCSTDAFATKLSPSGSSLVYSTYLGGGGRDWAYGIAVDPTGAAVVVGEVQTTPFIFFQKVNAIQPTYGGGDADAFVMKINPAGSAFVYSTYLGGNDYDTAYGVAVDASGAAYVTGYTSSTTFPTNNPFQNQLPDGAGAFVTKFSPNGQSRIYSTYLGGSGGAFGNSIAVDAGGAAYVAGSMWGSDFPLGAQVLGQPGTGGFLSKFDASGSVLAYSAFLENATAVTVDSSGAAFILGFDWAGVLQSINPIAGMPGPAFIAKLTVDGSAFEYKTHAGDLANWGIGNSIAVDTDGAVYVAGYSPASGQPYERDVRVSKFSDVAVPDLVAADASAVQGATVTLSATLTLEGAPLGGKTITFWISGSDVGSVVTDATGVATLTGASLLGLGAGSYPDIIEAIFAGDANYGAAMATATLTIDANKWQPTIAWAVPQPIVYGTPLSETQLNAVARFNGAAVAGSYVYNPPSGTVLLPGNQTLSVTFYPLDAASFGTANATTTLVVNRAPTTTTIQPNWVPLNTTGSPPPSAFVGGASAVSDGAGRLILFGGGVAPANTNDVRVLSGVGGSSGTPVWTKLSPTPWGTELPSPRRGHAAAYDPNTNTLIVFGGCGGGCLPLLNDVWVLANANGTGGTPAWKRLSPLGTPPAPRHAMAHGYDPATNRLIIFSGQDGSGDTGSTFTDVWVLTNANGAEASPPQWIQLAPTGTAPSGQYGTSSFYDVATNRLVVAGGFSHGTSSQMTNALWVLTNANGTGPATPSWINPVSQGAAGSPPNFSFWPVAYDQSSNRAFLVETGTPNVWVLQNANGVVSPTFTRVGPGVGAPAGAYIADSAHALYDASTNVLSTLYQVSGTSQVYALPTPDGLSYSVLGQSVMFTATVREDIAGSGMPAGVVTFTDGGNILGTATLDGSGLAAYTTAVLTGGLHSIVATYGGDSTHTGGSSPTLWHTVARATTSTTLTSTPNPSATGDPVAFTATVTSPITGVATPGGTVTFMDGAVELGSQAVGADGRAVFSTTALVTAGTHLITAAYNGDASFSGSTSDVLSQVVKARPDIAWTLDPVTYGTGVGAGPNPTASYQGASVAGSFAYSPAAGTLLPAGDHPISLTFTPSDTITYATVTLTRTLTVNRATLTVRAADKIWEYGHPRPLLTARISGFVNGENYDTGGVTGVWALDTTATPSSPPGLYVITPSLGTLAAANYAFAFTNGTMTVRDTTAPVVSFEASLQDTVFTSSPAVIRVQARDLRGVGSLAINGVSATLVPGGTAQDGAWEASVPVSLAALNTFSAQALDFSGLLGTATVIADGDGIAASVDRNKTTGANEADIFSSDFRADDETTLGTIVERGNWVVSIGPDPGPLQRASISPGPSGSGTIAKIHACEGAIKEIQLNEALETADFACGLQSPGEITPPSTITVRAIETTATVQVFKDLDGGFELELDLEKGETGSTGSPVTAGPNNVSPILVKILDATGAIVGFFELDAAEAVDVSTTPGPNGTTNIEIDVLASNNGVTVTAYGVSRTLSAGDPPTAFTQDTTPPAIGAVVDVVAEATSPAGAVVSFTLPDVTDDTDPAPAVSASPASGSQFPLGTTTVTVTAVDASGNRSSKTFTVTVVQASTTTGVVAAPNPSTYGQSVTITATVSRAGGAVTDGSVTFSEGSTVLAGPLTLGATGEVSVALGTLAAGDHVITVTYSGAVAFKTSQGATTQTVNKAATTTALGSSTDPSAFGESVTFTASVSSSAGTPTGPVTFKDGTTTLGTGTLNGSGQATFTTTGLSVGTRSITAEYAGDGNFTASTSNVLEQQVNQAPTTTTLSSSSRPSVFGQAVTFTAAVSSSAGTPAGTVTFKDGVHSLGSVVLNASGEATFTAQLSAGSHSLVAEYGGATDYATSTSNTLSQAVGKATLTVTADDQARTYGSADPPFTASFAGFVNGETLETSGITGAPSLTATATQTSAVGSYTIAAAQGSLAADNYSFAFVDGTLVVSARKVTVTADAQAMVYGEADPALTYEITDGSLVAGDSFSGALSRAPGSTIGTYAITQGTLALGTNYELSFVGANLTLTARKVTVTADAQTKVYG
ncbi:MAG: Ig-like domain repeat protein, partial [Acidobacteria bacterium]|nr:Ig-like domain repeat protein [Acidobacteriota bacterium]